MEMMTMMMDLDKLPDPFPHPFQDLSDSSIMDLNFSGENPTTNVHRATPPLLQNPNPIYPSPEQQLTIPSPQFGDHFPRASWLHGQKPDSVEAMREMIFRMAALQPVQIDPEAIKPLKRRNVKISNDPQTVAARHRRERISQRIRILQRLVPGGTKMDTASMLDEAAHYMKFLQKQVQSLEQVAAAAGGRTVVNIGGCYPTGTTTTKDHHGTNNSYSPLVRACGQHVT